MREAECCWVSDVRDDGLRLDMGDWMRTGAGAEGFSGVGQQHLRDESRGRAVVGTALSEMWEGRPRRRKKPMVNDFYW